MMWIGRKVCSCPLAAVAAEAFGVASSVGVPSPVAAQTTLKIWHGDPPEVTLPGHKLTSPYQGGAQRLKEVVEAKTGGRYTVRIFSGGQLFGGEREAIEALKLMASHRRA